MNLSLKFRDRLYSISTWLVQELDQALTAIRSVWDTEHNDDGTHGDVTVTKLTLTAGGTPEDRAQGRNTGVIDQVGAIGSLAAVNTFDGDIRVQDNQNGTTVTPVQIGYGPGINEAGDPFRSGIFWPTVPNTNSLALVRGQKPAYMSGGQAFGLNLWDLAVSNANPVLAYGTDGGTPVLGSGNAGSRIQIGTATRSVGDGYFQNLFTAEGKVGGWTAWTPTWTNLTVGNGSVTANYARVGAITFIEVILVWGTTTAITGAVSIGSLPVNQSAASIQNWGVNYYFDSSAGLVIFGGNQPTAATTAALGFFNNTAAGVTSTAVTATTPFTWATSDQLYILGFYR